MKNSFGVFKVMHSGIQHSPRLAYALQKSNFLKKFYVGYYLKENTFFAKTVKLFNLKLYKVFLKKRYFKNVDFEDQKILTFPYFNFLLVFSHIILKKIGNNNTIWLTYLGNFFFDLYLKNFHITKDDKFIISYLNTALFTFRKIKKNGGVCILDFATVHFDTIDEILRDELNFSPEFKSQLSSTNKPNMKRINNEIKLSDFIIVPSLFCKSTMISNGVNESKIRVIPYGCNFKPIQIEKLNEYRTNEILKILYVGQIQQRKGIKYILQTCDKLMSEGFDIELTLIGNLYGEVNKFEKYKSFNHIGFLNHDTLREKMINSHILLLPTLYDSFGLVVLEAMANGLMPIVSENAGAKDVISEKEGFIVPIRDVNETYNIIKEIILNPEILNVKRKECLKKVEQYSWDRYYHEIKMFVETLM